MEPEPKVTVGELVELIAAPAAPEKPVVFAVLNVPLMVTVLVEANTFENVPPSRVAPALTVKLPTTLVAEVAAERVAPFPEVFEMTRVL